MEKKRSDRSQSRLLLSTSSRRPNEYDEVMGITQADPREAEGFEEGLDSEYHDAAEEPQDTNNRNLSICLVFPTGVVVVHHCKSV